MQVITSFSGENAFLSNFHPSPFTWNGSAFRTNEHFYQALKCKGFDQFEAIRLADTPGKAKRYGRKCVLREDWEQVKLSVMWQGLTLKFNSNPGLRERLLATGDAILVEGNTWGDTYWGQCNGVGANHLGAMLMHLRTAMR